MAPAVDALDACLAFPSRGRNPWHGAVPGSRPIQYFQGGGGPAVTATGASFELRL